MKTKRFTIRLRGDRHLFIVGMHLERELIGAIAAQGQRRVAIIADTNTARLSGARILAAVKRSGHDAKLFTFAGGERRKDQATVSRLTHALLKARLGRDTLIVALGGGVVGDVAGFLAATYLRGVPYIQVPTTVLSMVDSSVGGKVGVDTSFGKNTVGAFHQPRAVIADLRFLSKLPKRHIINGLLEAVKKFITSDKAALKLVEKLDLDTPLKNPALLQEIILRSVRGKAILVMRDEKERGQRQVLNFGHTIGHALELLSAYSLPHGYAVGYGILVETQIATLLGILPESERAYVEQYLGRFGIKRAALKKFRVAKILAATRGDKKVRAGLPHYVLLKRVGAVQQTGGAFTHPVKDATVRRAFTALMSGRLWRPSARKAAR